MSADRSAPIRPAASEPASVAPFERLAPIRFGRETCGDLAAAERREWWVGNGRGAYAAGTVALSLTRRYHGLLIAPTEPPLGRALVLAKADAELVIGERRYPLFANRWASGAIAPEGHLAIESFHLDGAIPVWLFAVGGCRIEQRIWMEPGAHTTYVAWRLLAAPDGVAPRLSVALLANGRDHHGDSWMPGFAPEIAAENGALSVTVPGRFALHVRAPGGAIAAQRQWIENFDLPIERERGLPDRDHHLCVGGTELRLEPGQWCGIIASLHPNAAPDIAAAMARRREHDRRAIDRAAAADPVFATAPGWVMAPDQPAYRGRYRGGVVERDGSYHQGPVWAWLLGHWALAHYRVHGDAAAAQAWLEPIGDHLADAGLGQVSEIFDGDPPHNPRGAPAQAWSVSCTLEAWWRLERARHESMQQRRRR